MKLGLHSTPISKEQNLLDRLSSVDRFRYHGEQFLLDEKRLVSKKIRATVPRGRVLNVGCGRNGTERNLFPAANYEIVGGDINEESLQILREKKVYDGVCRGCISWLPFVSESFDIIYLRLVLHHLVYPKNLVNKGLEECFRVLRSGGILGLVEPNSWHPIGALMNIAHRLGLDIYIHGTDGDVALSPVKLRRQLSKYGSEVSLDVVTYSWRRLPIGLQALCNCLQKKVIQPEVPILRPHINGNHR